MIYIQFCPQAQIELQREYQSSKYFWKISSTLFDYTFSSFFIYRISIFMDMYC